MHRRFTHGCCAHDNRDYLIESVSITNWLTNYKHNEQGKGRRRSLQYSSNLEHKPGASLATASIQERKHVYFTEAVECKWYSSDNRHDIRPTGTVRNIIVLIFNI